MTGPTGTASVAAVVVSYNAGGHLAACLASLGSEGVETLIVVDNGSTDCSRHVAKDYGAVWIESGGNLGYGRAANRGASAPAASGADYLLVCNPDIEMRTGSVAALVSALQADSTLAVAAPRLSNADGSLYPSARTFPRLTDALGHAVLGMVVPSNRYTRRYRLLDWDHREPAHVDWVSGACFLAKRSAWESVGGFDPAYFMYMEDVDLCWRLGRAGWAIGYEPSAEVVHVQGVSADRHPYRMLLAHHRSMWLFATRTSEGRRRAALPLVLVGLAGRLLVTVTRRWLAGRLGAPGRPASRPLP